jgi:hypothetical protein
MQCPIPSRWRPAHLASPAAKLRIKNLASQQQTNNKPQIPHFSLKSTHPNSPHPSTINIHTPLIVVFNHQGRQPRREPGPKHSRAYFSARRNPQFPT